MLRKEAKLLKDKELKVKKTEAQEDTDMKSIL